jgi:hypothetical protein
VHDHEVWRRWLVFAALLPYAVHHDHRAERIEWEQRLSQERAHRLMQRLPIRIPTQRRQTIAVPRREAVPRGTGPWHG